MKTIDLGPMYLTLSMALSAVGRDLTLSEEHIFEDWAGKEGVVMPQSGTTGMMKMEENNLG